MRPSRSLLPLISSVVFCIVVWTSDVHALSVTVKTLDINNNAVLTTGTINFTSSATLAPGCVSGAGWACNTVTGWSGGNGGSLSFGSGVNRIGITTNPGYTSGPTASVYAPGSSMSFALNGFNFQGFSSGAGRLQITLTNNFTNLTAGTRTYGFMESGNFLQPSVGASLGNVSGDKLTMQALVNGVTPFPVPAVLKTAGTGTSFPYSFNLSPTASRTTSAGGATLTYTWLYDYSNSGGPVTSKFSDPAGGNGNCEISSQNPGCQSTIGGVGVFGASDEDLPFILQTLSVTTGVPVPEPSSLLLLGSGLLSGGLFFASRLRKEKERETR